MKQFVAQFVREDHGQDLIEYAFLAAFIALVVWGSIQTLGNNLNTRFNTIATSVSAP